MKKSIYYIGVGLLSVNIGIALPPATSHQPLSFNIQMQTLVNTQCCSNLSSAVYSQAALTVQGVYTEPACQGLVTDMNQQSSYNCKLTQPGCSMSTLVQSCFNGNAHGPTASTYNH